MQTAFSGTKIAGFWKLLIVVSCLWTNGDVIRHTGALSRFCVFFKMGENNLSTLERFLYDLEMITHEQNRNNKRTEIERFDWSICHFDVILQHDWPIQQCLVQWYRVFFGGKTKSPCFDLYIYWLIKQITNTCRNHFSRSYENRSKYGYILFGKRSENIRTTERSKADLSVGNIYILANITKGMASGSCKWLEKYMFSQTSGQVWTRRQNHPVPSLAVQCPPLSFLNAKKQTVFGLGLLSTPNPRQTSRLVLSDGSRVGGSERLVRERFRFPFTQSRVEVTLSSRAARLSEALT